MHGVDDVVVHLGVFNGLMDMCVGLFHGVHEGYDVGERNLNGRILLDICLQKVLFVSNT